MKRNWTLDELIDYWTLNDDEMTFVRRYKTPANRIGVATLFKYFQIAGRFPYRRRDIPQASINFLARQLGEPPMLFAEYSWRGRAIKFHRSAIRNHFGFREGTVADANRIGIWLCEHVLPVEGKLDEIMATVYEQYRQEKIEPPTTGRVERIVRSAQRRYSEQFCTAIAMQLSTDTKQKLDHLLKRGPNDAGNIDGYSPFARLKRDAGKISLKSILSEIAKLELIQQLDLPKDLFKDVPHHVIQLYQERVTPERPREVLRHPDNLRYTLLAAFCYLRGRVIADNLVDLFIGIIKRINKNAEKTMVRRLLQEIQRVRGKSKLLFEIAKVSLNKPNNLVNETIYPIASEETLQRVVDEYEATHAYEIELKQTARQSYARHYRQMVPPLLKALQFRSDNEALQPLTQAVTLIQSFVGTRHQYYPDTEDVPLNDIVTDAWQTAVVQVNKEGHKRINRISYEICVFQQLHEQLRCRAVWIEDANRYRNPDDDLPIDFDSKKTHYYMALKQPQSAETFVAQLRQQMVDSLTKLNDDLLKNQWLQLDENRKHPLILTPLPAQEDPIHLSQLKQAIQQRWSMTPLLDMLKETDIRVGFTNRFQTSGNREQMDAETLRKRLLLCLYGVNLTYVR